MLPLNKFEHQHHFLDTFSKKVYYNVICGFVKVVQVTTKTSLIFNLFTRLQVMVALQKEFKDNKDS